MSVLLLGASGFLGSWVARALVATGEETVALVRPSSELWRIAPVGELTVVREPTEHWASVVADLAPETVLSLEWSGVAGADRNDPSQWDNLGRLAALIEASITSGVRRFIGVGSQAEYGPRSDTISESAPAAPVTEYGRAKAAAAELLRERADAAGMKWVWVRVFSTYGPLDHPYWVLPQLAAPLLRGERVPLTDGLQLWSYLCGPDAGSAFATLVGAAGARGIYNLGHPHAPALRGTVERFAAELVDATHRPLPSALLDFGAIPHGPTSVMKLQPDVARLSRLGWTPRIDLEAGLSMTAAWLTGHEVRDPFHEDRVLPTDPHAISA